MFPFIKPESIIETTFEDMEKLLLQDNVQFSDLSDGVRGKVEPLGTGSCILVHKYDMNERIKCPSSEKSSQESVDTITVPICGWKGKFTLRPYIAKNERIHFLRLIGVDTKTSEDEFKARFEAKMERKNMRRNPEYKEKVEEANGKEADGPTDKSDDAKQDVVDPGGDNGDQNGS